MNYEKGQDVVIRRNLGIEHGNGKSGYYYGGSVSNVPLGSKGTIEYVSEKKIDVRLSNGNRWNVHPNELRTSKETEEAEKKRQEAKNSQLEEILQLEEPTTQKDAKKEPMSIEEVVVPKVLIKLNLAEQYKKIMLRIKNYGNEISKTTDDSIKKSEPFKPEFNPREEYAVWVRQEFPELKDYAKKEKEYDSLEKRKIEVMNGAKMAYEHGTKTLRGCALIDFRTVYCTFNGQKPDGLYYSDFATYSGVFAARLEKFVSFIEFLSLNLESISSNGYKKHHGTKKMDD